MRRAHYLRKASVSKSTLNTRERQWACYVKICKKFRWSPYGCNSSQACKYVAFLSKAMRYSSVVNYYQTVIFYHNLKGKPVAGWSDPMLAQTVKGIKNLEQIPEDVKDPLKEEHLYKMFQKVNVRKEFDILVWTVIIFLFRTLLRVGHVVVSPHTLRRRDVKFFKWGALVTIRSSKTRQKGNPHEIPISRSKNLEVCPVFWVEKLLKLFPKGESELLFSSKEYSKLSYSTFNRAFKNLISKSKIQGNFSTHSLRRGGDDSHESCGGPLVPY